MDVNLGLRIVVRFQKEIFNVLPIELPGSLRPPLGKECLLDWLCFSFPSSDGYHIFSPIRSLVGYESIASNFVVSNGKVSWNSIPRYINLDIGLVGNGELCFW